MKLVSLKSKKYLSELSAPPVELVIWQDLIIKVWLLIRGVLTNRCPAIISACAYCLLLSESTSLKSLNSVSERKPSTIVEVNTLASTSQ